MIGSYRKVSAKIDCIKDDTNVEKFITSSKSLSKENKTLAKIDVI